MKKPINIVLLCCGAAALTACGGVPGFGSSSDSADADSSDGTEIVEDADATDVVDDSGATETVTEGDTSEALGITDRDSGADIDVTVPQSTDSSGTSTSGTKEATSSSSTSLPTPIGAAGTVELLVDGNTVTLGSVDLADGWTETSRSLNNGDVDLYVGSANTSIHLDADVESGQVLDVDIDTYWQLAAGSHVESTIAGDITVVYTGSGVTFGAFDLNDGWEITAQGGDDDEIGVTITDRSSNDTVRVTAEVDDGRGEIDTRTRIALNR